MRWIADECVSRNVVEVLRAQGHDVLYIARFRMRFLEP
jgi:hypothetical protein